MDNIKKTYPQTIMLRKNIIIIAGIVLLAIAMMIFFNIHRSTRHRPKTSTLNTTTTTAINNNVNTTTSSEKWYKHLKIQKALPNANTPQSKTETYDNDSADNDGDQDQTNETMQPNQLTKLSNKLRHQLNMQEVEDLKKAMSAPISANQITNVVSPEGVANNNQPAQTLYPHQENHQKTLSALTQQQDQNLQKEKKTFLKFSNQNNGTYLHEEVKDPLNPYELKAGSIIPAILVTGINSDLPGQITAQVRSNIYDSIGGKHLLIPQGAKLTGLYDAQVAYGQQRVLVVWQRIILPNGQSISLEGMPGVDMSGYAGLNDQVNNHYFRIFGAAILMSVISSGAQLSQPQQLGTSSNSGQQPSIGQTLAASLGTNIMNTANVLVQKNLGIQPTLIIRPGYLFNVSVTKDIIFPDTYHEETRYIN